MEEAKKTGHGGARMGAGRRIRGDAKRVAVAFRVLPSTKARMTELADENGISIGELIDLLVEGEMPVEKIPHPLPPSVPMPAPTPRM